MAGGIREILVEQGHRVPDERLYEQIRRAIVWIAGDVAEKVRGNQGLYKVLRGTVRLVRGSLPLLKAYRLPPLGGDVYRDYVSRAIAALEITDPSFIGEALALRECLRGKIAAQEVLLEAIESIEKAAERLSKTCGAGYDTSLLIVYTSLAGIANGLRLLVEDEVKPGKPTICPLCGRKPVLVGEARDYAEASCGLCGLTWRIEKGVCPACGANTLEERGSTGDHSILYCSSCGNLFLVARGVSGEALPVLAGEAFIALRLYSRRENG